MKIMNIFILLALTIIGCNSLLAAEMENESSIEVLLLKQLDEERMAHRLYNELGNVHAGMKPFRNIPRTESRHFNALTAYAKSYFPGIEVADLNGEFHFETTKELYETWLKKGKTSRQAAAEVGVELEKLDIADIDHFLTRKPDAELTAILESLKEGSQRHLAAFERHLSGNNATGSMKTSGNSAKQGGCSHSHK